MGVKVEIFPDALDVLGVSSNQLRQQVIFEQVEDRTSTSTNGVGVANACLSIFIDDGDNRGLLGDERLDGISALDLRIQIDQLELNLLNVRHCASLKN